MPCTNDKQEIIMNSNLHTIAKNLYDISRQLRIFNENTGKLIETLKESNTKEILNRYETSVAELGADLGLNVSEVRPLAVNEEEMAHGDDTDA